MIRATANVRGLAARFVKPRFSRNSTPSIGLSSTTTPRSFSAKTTYPSLEKGTSRRKAIQQRSSTGQTVRHCSHRRAMCRKTTEAVGGSVDVKASREVLPTNVKPLHYVLTLEPDFKKFSYEGTVVIEYVW